MNPKEAFLAQNRIDGMVAIPQRSPFRPDIPLNRPPIDSELENTSGHELGHAIAVNFKVISISVKPEGYTLGRTVIAGNISLAELQIGAAAGAVPTHDGHASGYGSDMQTVRRAGNLSENASKSEASSRIHKYSDKERAKAAQIIAYLGEISGSELPEIMARACWEVAMENNQQWVVMADYEDIQSENSIDEKNDEVTIVDHFKDGSIKVTHMKGDEIRSTEILYANDDSQMLDEEKRNRELKRSADIFVARNHILENVGV